MTNQELINGWMNEFKNSKKSQGTIKMYSSILNQFDRFVGKSFIEVTREDIIPYLGTKKSVNTKALNQTVLISFYQWMIDTEKMDKHPMNKRVSLGRQEREYNKLTKGQYQEIKKWIRKNLNERDRLLFSVLFGSGMRASATLNIRISDIKDCLLTTIGKGDKEKTIGLSKELANKIQKYVKDNGLQGNDYLLSKIQGQKKGEKLSKSYLDYLCRLISERTGIKFHCHMTRHFFADTCVNGGMTIERLSSQLGHSTLEQTRRYFTVDPNVLANDVDKFAPAV